MRPQPLEEIASERIVRATDRTVRFADQLWDDVKVANRFEERCKLPKRSVDIDLLEIGLRQSFRVSPIIPIRSFQESLSVPSDLFFPDQRPALFVLIEVQFVIPLQG